LQSGLGKFDANGWSSQCSYAAKGRVVGKDFLSTSNRAAEDAKKVSKGLAMPKALIVSQIA